MTRLRSALSRIDPGPDGAPGRRELQLLLAFVAVGVLVRLVYAVWLRGDPLSGDLPGYHAAASLFADGKPFWGIEPYGQPHVSAWKAPGYWAWSGSIYTLLGSSPFRVAVVQALVCGPAVITLTWLLGRRLLDRNVALTAAGIMAVYPNAFQFEQLLYPESIAQPLGLLLMVVTLTRAPTTRIAVIGGVLLAVGMLIRPSSVYFATGILVFWWVGSGLRPMLRHGLVMAICAGLVIVPWTIRNAVVMDGFIPISVQDAAIAGTFNDDAANDERLPWAWRPVVSRDRDLLETPRSELQLRKDLIERGRQYISDNPSSVAKAFFWNGLSRTWDVRRPVHVADETNYDGRKRRVTQAGLAMYWVLLPLAFVGLWRLRRRQRALVLAIGAWALSASVVFTIVASTRYRVTLEPLVVLLAAAGIVPAVLRRRDGSGRPAV